MNKNLAQKVDFLAKCRPNQDCRSICAGTVFTFFNRLHTVFDSNTKQIHLK